MSMVYILPLFFLKSFFFFFFLIPRSPRGQFEGENGKNGIYHSYQS
jgi:hypothetical protein